MLEVEKPLRAEARDQGLQQHWVDFPDRKVTCVTKAQQKKLVGSVAVDESQLSQTAVRTLMATCADNAIAKAEVRLEQRFEDGLAGVETSMGSLETTVMTQLKAVADELKTEIQQSRKGSNGGGKDKWNRPQWQQQQQPRGWGRPPTLSNWQQQRPAQNSTASAPPQGQVCNWGSHAGPADKWGSHRKPVDRWNGGDNHFARDCQQQTDAANPQVRRGANAVSVSLAGGGGVTTDRVEGQVGSVEGDRSWLAAVYDATENWMAAVQWNQGADGMSAEAVCAVSDWPTLTLISSLYSDATGGWDEK